MPRKANFIFDVRIRIAEAFTLDSIVRSPRTFKPKDVLAACHNNELDVKQGSPPPEVVALVTYIMSDFFAVAHATGLYNRQRRLWESLAQVNAIHVYQLTKGLMHKQSLPMYDVSLLDYKGNPLLYAFLVGSEADKSNSLSLLKGFLSRMQSRSSLTGSLICFQKPTSPQVLEYLSKLTFSNDPIIRYESIMPSLHVPVDLVEMDKSTDPPTFALLHPELKKGNNGDEAYRTMKKTMPKPKSDESLMETAEARTDAH